MKKYIALTALFIFLFSPTLRAEENLAKKLSGYLLLQVESRGEAWYVNPADEKKYSLGKPADAFSIMSNLGVGITNNDLSKIPVGLIEYGDNDDDNDGLSNRLENSLGTDPENSDSDNDGYNDKMEIENNYDPTSLDKFNYDNNFIQQNLGKIFLQVENNGEAWYVNPTDEKRYFLSRPSEAFAVMRQLSLGITNENLNKIASGYVIQPETTPPEICLNCQNDNTDLIIDSAASAIRTGDTEEALSYFSPQMQTAVEYTMNILDAEGRLILANIISGSTLADSTEDKKTYSNEVYFSLGGYSVPVNFYLEKQDDDSWLLTNL